MLFFLCKLQYYHVSKLLAKIGVRKMTLVAWVSAQPLILAYFSIDSARAPSPRTHHSSFYP